MSDKHTVRKAFDIFRDEGVMSLGSSIKAYLSHYYSMDKLSKNFDRNVMHREAALYSQTRNTSASPTVEDALHKSMFGDLKMGNNQKGNFQTYLKLCNFAYHFGCESVLEIGAGYSTAIWAKYVDNTDAEVTSVDADFQLLEDKLSGTGHEESIKTKVTTVKGVSVSPEEIRRFYNDPQSDIGGLNINEFADSLDVFARAHGCPYKRLKMANSAADRRNWSVKDVVVSEGTYQVPSGYLRLRIDQESIDKHVNAISKGNQTNVLGSLLESSGEWDLIWFDSGEVSSIVEWVKIKDYVKKGGLVAFHDVFFPKSMKNFVVAASLLHDPDWEVLLIDRSTPQGLLIARRKRKASN